jgi:hypothetical protein
MNSAPNPSPAIATLIFLAAIRGEEALDAFGEGCDHASVVMTQFAPTAVKV